MQSGGKRAQWLECVCCILVASHGSLSHASLCMRLPLLHKRPSKIPNGPPTQPLCTQPAKQQISVRTHTTPSPRIALTFRETPVSERDPSALSHPHELPCDRHARIRETDKTQEKRERGYDISLCLTTDRSIWHAPESNCVTRHDFCH